MNQKSYIFLFVIICIWSCGDQNSTADTGFSQSQNTLSKDTTEIEGSTDDRSVWQKPSVVIEKLGDISDKVIADLGAGLGYFSFKLTPRAQKVIAIDIDTQMINFIESNKDKYLGPMSEKLECRLAYPDNPNLKSEEVDILLIINTITYLPNLSEYLKTIKKTLKPEGYIIIVDYKMKKLPISAPPKSNRIYLDQLEDLLENSGYTILESDDTSLDYQFIIKAKNQTINND